MDLLMWTMAVRGLQRQERSHNQEDKMATITLDIPQGILKRVEDSFFEKYAAQFPTQSAAMTKIDFAKFVVAGFMKEVTKGNEGEKAAKSARKTAVDKAEAEINIT